MALLGNCHLDAKGKALNISAWVFGPKKGSDLCDTFTFKARDRPDTSVRKLWSCESNFAVGLSHSDVWSAYCYFFFLKFRKSSNFATILIPEHIHKDFKNGNISVTFRQRLNVSYYVDIMPKLALYGLDFWEICLPGSKGRL